MVGRGSERLKCGADQAVVRSLPPSTLSASDLSSPPLAVMRTSSRIMASCLLQGFRFLIEVAERQPCNYGT